MTESWDTVSSQAPRGGATREEMNVHATDAPGADDVGVSYTTDTATMTA